MSFHENLAWEHHGSTCHKKHSSMISVCEEDGGCNLFEARHTREHVLTWTFSKFVTCSSQGTRHDSQVSSSTTEWYARFVCGISQMKLKMPCTRQVLSSVNVPVQIKLQFRANMSRAHPAIRRYHLQSLVPCTMRTKPKINYSLADHCLGRRSKLSSVHHNVHLLIRPVKERHSSKKDHRPGCPQIDLNMHVFVGHLRMSDVSVFSPARRFSCFHKPSTLLPPVSETSASILYIT